MQKAWIVLTRAVSISRSRRSQSACSSSAEAWVLQSLVAGVADAGPHFAGGRVGERDGDELAEPGRIDVGVASGRIEMREKARREDVRFAAAGAGGQRDRDVASVARSELFVGERGGRHGISDCGLRIAD